MFGFIILFTVISSGILAYWVTTNRFDILVTKEGQQRAEEIAPLLEASYAYWGNWDGLNEMLSLEMVETGFPLEMFEPAWYSDVDWWQVTVETLNLDEEMLSTYWHSWTSLATLVEEQGVDPNDLVQVIVEAEQTAVDAAVEAGQLTPEQAADEMQWVKDGVFWFVWDDPNLLSKVESAWDQIIAGELDISIDEIYSALSAGRPIAALAKERGVAPKHLVQQLVDWEKAALRERGDLPEQAIVFELANIESMAWEYIEPDLFFDPPMLSISAGTEWTDEGITWLVNTMLLGDERLLITDDEGQVVYDSSGDRLGERLPDSMLAQGASLLDYEQNTPSGTAIIAAGPGYYNAQQAAFLHSVSNSLLISGLAAGLLALLAGLVVAQRVTAPVTALTKATRRLASGHWEKRLPVNSDDELGQMSAAFNAMAAALETQRKLRNRLVDDLSHELHTPLSIIQLELEALRDGMQTPGEASAQVLHEIKLLRNLVSDLSLLTETDQEMLQLQLEPTDLVQLAGRAVVRWQAQAEAAGVELHLYFAETLPPVDADPLRLAQVLGNLIGNAIQYTPSGGRIEIHCQRAAADCPGGEVAMGSGHTRTYLWATVTDSGEGIPPENLPHIFERFYRADRSRSRQTGGRGLGLAIVRQIIEQHGGQVWVESKLMEGSSFGFSLPVCSGRSRV